MDNRLITDLDFEVAIIDAEYFLSEGNECKAISIIKKAFRRNDYFLSAYLYFKYKSFWKEILELYDFRFEIKKMGNYELFARMSDAIRLNKTVKKKNSSFRKFSENYFKNYLDNDVSLQKLMVLQSILEKKFIETSYFTPQFQKELKIIFKAYFYKRKAIKADIFKIYRKYIEFFYECETLENRIRRIDRRRVLLNKKWPKPLMCFVQKDGEDGIWSYIFIDPYIFDDSDTLMREENEKLISFFELLKMDRKSSANKGYNVISNWYKVSKNYPEIAQLFLKRGINYNMRREQYIENMEAEVDKKIKAIPEDERNKIVNIIDVYSGREIVVLSE